ncbi:MAG: RNA-binding protein [Actinobacteria bacterium]|nr:RNA-binding protein [Actinomycetota bacterium]MBU1493859.1 RNA-binding protein [Actinomycetota bacterium]
MRLYVGNLPFNVNSEDLEQMFSEYGEVTSSQVISDRETGRSRGFGFVELATDEAGRKAIEEMDGKDSGGRRLTVNVAREREERPRRHDR